MIKYNYTFSDSEIEEQLDDTIGMDEQVNGSHQFKKQKQGKQNDIFSDEYPGFRQVSR